MPRKAEERIDDIIECCEKILRFTSGMNQEQWVQQEIVMDAVLRNIEIIGEPAKHVPNDVRARMPGIEWKKIAGMRASGIERVEADTPASTARRRQVDQPTLF